MMSANNTLCSLPCVCLKVASWGYQSECNNRLIWACRLTYNIAYNINVPPRPSILCLCMYARMNNSKFWTVICIDNAMTQRQRQRQFHIGAPRAFLFYFIYFDPIVPAMFAEIHVLCTHTHTYIYISKRASMFTRIQYNINSVMCTYVWVYWRLAWRESLLLLWMKVRFVYQWLIAKAPALPKSFLCLLKRALKRGLRE